MEKPLALSTEQVLELGKLSEVNEVVLHTDHIIVFHPIIRKIKDMWDLAVHDLAVIDYLCGGQEAVQATATGMAYFGRREELTYLSIQYQNVIFM